LKNLVNIFLVLGIFVCFNIFKTYNFGVQTSEAAGPSLITNGDFTAVTNSFPTGWFATNSADGLQTATLAIGEEGNGVKIQTKGTKYQALAASPSFPVTLGEYFSVKFRYKLEPEDRTVSPVLYLAWDALKTDGSTKDSGIIAQLISVSLENCDGQWHDGQYTIFGIKSPEAKFARVRLGGLYHGIGSVTYDNVVVEKTQFLPDTTYGCLSSATAKCVDFGGAEDTGISPSTATYISEKKTEGDITYREIQNFKTITVDLPSWNVDVATGLPNKDLMLEIRYKDTFTADPLPVDYYNYYQEASQVAAVRTRTDFTKLEGYTDSLLGLGEFGDNTWKTAQLVFPKTNWQMIKSINGVYTVKIVMPSPTIANSSLTLPIDYVSLSEITPEAVVAFQKKQRDFRSLRQADYVETKTRPNFSGDFAWFTSSSTEQVFPNSYPVSSQINKSISLQSVLGETEPGNFSLITNNALSNVSFVVPDLVSSSGSISSSNISLYKVVYENKYWSNTTSNGSTYGLQPDRYEKFGSISLTANKTQQFYFTIAVPDSLAGGTYTGRIKIVVGGVEKATIPVSIEILPFKIDDAGYVPYLYHNPVDIGRYYHTGTATSDIEYNDKLFSDIAAHDMLATKSFGYFKPMLNTDGTMAFDYQDFDKILKESIAKGIVKDKAFYWNLPPLIDEIAAKLGLTTGTRWQKLSDPRFAPAFSAWIDGLELVAKANNIQIIYSVSDEPGTILDRRVLADKIYPLLRTKHVTTWVTYWESCETPVPCADCLPCPECVLDSSGVNSLPSIASFIDYKVYSATYLTDPNIIKQPTTFGYYITSYAQLRNPVYARFLQGIYPLKTGAKIVGNYAYGDMVADPYNEFDYNGYGRDSAGAPDYIMAYPSWDGQLIPTTAWEAAREGIKDAKYITALRGLISLDPTNLIAVEAKSYLDTVLAKVSSDFISSDTVKADDYGFASEIVRQLSASNDRKDPAAFDTIRSKVFGYIKQLRQATILISADKTNVAAGGIVEISVRVSNPYDSAINYVVVETPVPAGTEFVSVENEGSLVGSIVRWPEVDKLLPDASQVFRFSVRVK